MVYTSNILVTAGSKMVTYSSLLYLTAMVFYIFYLVLKNKPAGTAATITGSAGFILHLLSFIIRWVEFYKFSDDNILRAVPITNLYESLMFFSLLLAGVYLFLEYKTKNKSFGVFVFAVSGAVSLFIEALGAPSNLNPLVPALKSNWLLAHVSLSFTAYVCFTVSAVAALIYLIKTVKTKKCFAYFLYTTVLGVSCSVIITLVMHFLFNLHAVYIFFSSAVLCLILFWIYGLKFNKIFENISYDIDTIESITYKFIAVGFAIFTIGGIVFGAVWAEKSWGSYWSWDAKETWTFITWIVYGIYLHGRLSGRWSKEIAASLALIGFIVTIFTFLGVNLLLAGLHSYGSL